MNLPFGLAIRADFHGEFMLFFTILVVLVAVVFITNRRHLGSKDQLGKRNLWIIYLLRISALCILLLLVFDPQISIERTQIHSKKIAVILDDSRSMNQAWEGSSDQIWTSIENLVSRLENFHDIELWSMDGDKLNDIPREFTKTTSNFGWSPVRNASGKKDNIFSAAFLVSDGHLNSGRSPLDLSWSEKLPIYPVYPLNPQTNYELKIIKTAYAYDDLAGNLIDVEVHYLQEGLGGRSALITIQDESGQVLSTAPIRLAQDFGTHTIPTKFMSKEATQLHIALELDDGSLKSTNFMMIEEEKLGLNVLLVSDRLNDLHKFITLNLPDSLYRVSSVVGTKSELTQSISGLSGGNLDLIIINQPGVHFLEGPVNDLIKEAIEAFCPMLIFNNGLESAGPGWQELLGLKENKVINPGVSSTPYWSDTALDHPFYLGLFGRGFTAAELVKFPPIMQEGYFYSSDGAEILEWGLGQNKDPALIIKDTPPQVVFNGSGYWKWFFNLQARSAFGTMWDYLLLYMEDISNFKPVALDVPVEVEATGTQILASISVQDLDQKNISTAELRVWQENVSGDKTVLDLIQEESGDYSAKLNTIYPGETIIIAEAYRFGELWGRDTSRIQLVAFNGEDQSKGVDDVFLSRLARRSGGAIIQVNQDKMPNVPTQTYEQTTSFQVKGVYTKGLFLILLTLLILEWILRRRNGLL